MANKNDLSYRALCLLMAGLMGCSSARSQYVWRDTEARPQTGMAKAPQILDSWGAKPEGPDIADPQIAQGFLLTLRCLADNKLDGDYRVDFNGNLSLPYDMTVNTTGLTLTQVKRKLTDLYRPYFKNPSEIDVRLKERRYWVDVRGLVQKPGRYLVEPEASLDLIIGMADGFSRDTPPQSVRIQKGQKVFVLDLNQYYRRGEEHPRILGWLGGEELFFQKEIAAMGAESLPSSGKLPINILGEVKKPGEYAVGPGFDLLDTLIQAGGFTERADLDNIELIRRTAGGRRIYDFSWEGLSHAPALEQGDVVIVHAETTRKFERRTLLVATVIGMLTTVATATILVLAYNHGGLGTSH